MFVLTLAVSFALANGRRHKRRKWVVIKDFFTDDNVDRLGQIVEDKGTGNGYTVRIHIRDGREKHNVRSKNLSNRRNKSSNSRLQRGNEVRVTGDGAYKGKTGFLGHWEQPRSCWHVVFDETNDVWAFPETDLERTYIPSCFDELRNNSDIQWMIPVCTGVTSFVSFLCGSYSFALLSGAATWWISDPASFKATVSGAKDSVQEALKPDPAETEQGTHHSGQTNPPQTGPVPPSAQTPSEEKKPEEKDDSKVPTWFWIVLIFSGVACIAIVIFFILMKRRKPAHHDRRREEPLSPREFGEDRYDEDHDGRSPGRTRKSRFQ